MPYQNEHSARLKDPSGYDEFRRENNAFGEGIHAIYGIKTEDSKRKSELQAIRFDKDKFSADETRKWCKEHDHTVMSFEAASEEKNNGAMIEKRAFLFGLEHRENQSEQVMFGHAAIFDEEAEIMGFREKIARGAFTESIEKDDIRVLFNHNPDHVLGRNKAGTLKLSEDERGLAIEVIPPDTAFAKDLAKLMHRGDINQMSFGFQVIKERWESKSGYDLRTLEKVRLFDVSPVTYPAYEGTDIALRSHRNWLNNEKKEAIVPRGTIIRRMKLKLREAK